MSDSDAAAAPLADAIDAVERVLRHEAAGMAWNIPKTMTTWEPASSAHALGAVDLEDGLVAMKTWTNTPTGANAMLTLYDSADGRVLAVMEATTMGALRTAAVSGLATRWMSDPDADELAVIGSGRQALRQVAAVAAVRPLRRVRVWSPTAPNRASFADQIRTTLGLDTVESATLDDAVTGAPIVTLVTRAREPFLRLEHLARGAHLNAVGAILPGNAEFEPSLLAQADLTIVDSPDSARRGSRELREYYGDDWSGVWTLSDLVTGKITRPPSPRCTVFKGMGMGLSDLAVAARVWRRQERCST